MISRRTLRPAAIAAGPVMFVALIALACVDEPTKPDTDADWADDVVATLRVRSELQVMRQGVPIEGSLTAEGVTTTPVFPTTATRTGSGAFSRTVGQSRYIVRHLTDGKVIRSVGFVRDTHGKPPKRVYLFEDGRIRAIYSPKFETSGRGWIKKRATLVLFDSLGIPVLRHKLTADEIAAAPKWTDAVYASAKDALRAFSKTVLPRDAHAAPPSLDCWKEFLGTLGLGVSTSATIATTIVSGGACGVTFTTAVPACLLALSSAGLSLTQIAAVVWSFDQLIACEMKAGLSSVINGGGPDPATVPKAPVDNTYVKTTQTVEDFIDNAERNNTYQCSQGGDVCTYWAE